MTRYTINIGDEFPLNDEAPGSSGRRFGFGLRVLFVLALAVIVLSHPFHAVVFLGLALVIRRTRWFEQARARWRQGAAMRREYWKNGGGCGQRWSDRRSDRRWSDQRPDRTEPRDETRDRYKAFV